MLADLYLLEHRSNEQTLRRDLALRAAARRCPGCIVPARLMHELVEHVLRRITAGTQQPECCAA